MSIPLLHFLVTFCKMLLKEVTDMTIADRIKIKRVDLDMSQTELALKAGYNNKAAISKLEHAGDDISMKQIKRVAKALGVSPAFLMGWEDDITYVKVETTAKMLPNTILIKDGVPIELESPDEKEEYLNRAIKYYELYQNASPEIQQAVESILKSSQPKP